MNTAIHNEQGGQVYTYRRLVAEALSIDISAAGKKEVMTSTSKG